MRLLKLVLFMLLLTNCSTPKTPKNPPVMEPVMESDEPPVTKATTSPTAEPYTTEYQFLALSGTVGRAAMLRANANGAPDPDGNCLVFGLGLTTEDWKVVQAEWQASCVVVGDAPTRETIANRNIKTYAIEAVLKSDGGRLVYNDIVVRMKDFGDDVGLIGPVWVPNTTEEAIVVTLGIEGVAEPEEKPAVQSPYGNSCAPPQYSMYWFSEEDGCEFG